MLVLSRKVGEVVQGYLRPEGWRIGDPDPNDPVVELVVIEVSGDKVRLGLRAPLALDLVRVERLTGDPTLTPQAKEGRPDWERHPRAA